MLRIIIKHNIFTPTYHLPAASIYLYSHPHIYEIKYKNRVKYQKLINIRDNNKKKNENSKILKSNLKFIFDFYIE